jgi:hypothetical protein
VIEKFQENARRSAVIGAASLISGRSSRQLQNRSFWRGLERPGTRGQFAYSRKQQLSFCRCCSRLAALDDVWHVLLSANHCDIGIEAGADAERPARRGSN